MSSQRTIVVIEDEATIADAIAQRLRKEGFRLEVAGDGIHGVELCEKVKPDLVVLDLMLPELDGIEVCRRIQRDRHVPVMMLTARDSETDVLVGLGVGADDYMTKPFSMGELVARVHVILRRAARSAPAGDPIVRAALEIDPARRQVRKSGHVVHLTPLEFDLVHLLAARPEVVHTRAQLLREIWGYEASGGERTVDTHVGAIRRKLGAETIRTVHGVGYALGEG